METSIPTPNNINTTSPLPDGFILTLLQELHLTTQSHLLRNLFNLKGFCGKRFELLGKDRDDDNIDKVEITQLQSFIFSNITSFSPQIHFCTDFNTTILGLIMAGVVPNLEELWITLPWDLRNTSNPYPPIFASSPLFPQQHHDNDCIPTRLDYIQMNGELYDDDNYINGGFNGEDDDDCSSESSSYTPSLYSNDGSFEYDGGHHDSSDLLNNEIGMVSKESTDENKNTNDNLISNDTNNNTNNPTTNTPSPLHPSFSTALKSLPKLHTLVIYGIKSNADPFCDNYETSFESILPDLFPPLSSFPLLKKLSFPRNQLDARDFHHLATVSFPSLESIDLLNNELDGGLSIKACIRWLGTLPNLKRLVNPLHTRPAFQPQLIKYLANSPILSRLESLHCGFTHKPYEDTITLLTSDHFKKNQHIKWLSFRRVNLDKELATLLFNSSPNLSNLEELEINVCMVPYESIVLLCQSAYIKKLTLLDLSSTSTTTDATLRELSNSENLVNLTKLGLFGTHITSVGLGYIGQSHYLKKLTELSYFNRQDFSKAKPFIEFISSPNIINFTRLQLTDVRLSSGSLQALVKSHYLKNLKHFEVTGVDKGIIASNWLDPMFKTPSVRAICTTKSIDPDVNVSYVDGDAKIVKGGEIKKTKPRINFSLTFSNLTHLNLSGCNLTNKDLYNLSQCPSLSNLDCLILNNNQQIDDDGILYLFNSPYLIHLKTLHIDMCTKVTPQSLHNLTHFPSFLHQLKELSMWNEQTKREHYRIVIASPYFRGIIRAY